MRKSMRGHTSQPFIAAIPFFFHFCIVELQKLVSSVRWSIDANNILLYLVYFLFAQMTRK